MMGTYFVEVHVSLDGVCFCLCQKATIRAWSLTSVLSKIYELKVIKHKEGISDEVLVVFSER